MDYHRCEELQLNAKTNVSKRPHWLWIILAVFVQCYSHPLALPSIILQFQHRGLSAVKNGGMTLSKSSCNALEPPRLSIHSSNRARSKVCDYGKPTILNMRLLG